MPLNDFRERERERDTPKTREIPDSRGLKHISACPSMEKREINDYSDDDKVSEFSCRLKNVNLIYFSPEDC